MKRRNKTLIVSSVIAGALVGGYTIFKQLGYTGILIICSQDKQISINKVNVKKIKQQSFSAGLDIGLLDPMNHTFKVNYTLYF